MLLEGRLEHGRVGQEGRTEAHPLLVLLIVTEHVGVEHVTGQRGEVLEHHLVLLQHAGVAHVGGGQLRGHLLLLMLMVVGGWSLLLWGVAGGHDGGAHVGRGGAVEVVEVDRMMIRVLASSGLLAHHKGREVRTDVALVCDNKNATC